MHIKIARRSFLKSAAVASTLGVAPTFLSRAAETNAHRLAADPEGPILVVVQLGGGNDGLNTVVPYQDDAYYNARPELALTKNALIPLNDEAALHGQLDGFKRLYDAGEMAIIQGVGYPNPNRSHFRSMDIWQTASDSDKYLGTGWLGRYFDNACPGSAPPETGIALSKEQPMAFAGGKICISLDHPSNFGWRHDQEKSGESNLQRINAGAPGANGALDFLRHTTSDAVMSSQAIRRAADDAGLHRGKHEPLEVVAGLIQGGLQTRIYYVSYSGFDTHANQGPRHQNLLRRFSKAMATFQKRIKDSGHADRVLTMVFSEFGRRVKENASGGTDHGVAGPMFLMGSKVAPGLHGAAPSLSDLDGGDLKHTVDFRRVYATVLEGWLRAESTPILGQPFLPMDLLA